MVDGRAGGELVEEDRIVENRELEVDGLSALKELTIQIPNAD